MWFIEKENLTHEMELATGRLATFYLRPHGMLMNGRQDLRSIGAYRTHADPMQVVSGAMHEPSVHFLRSFA
ncbi:MAG: hypothetical protein WD490_09780 [Opitutales bacterium]